MKFQKQQQQKTKPGDNSPLKKAAQAAKPVDSDDDDEDDDLSDDGNVKPPLPKVVPPGKKSPAVAKQAVAKQAIKRVEGDDLSEDESPPPAKKAAIAMSPSVKQQTPVAKQQTPAAKQLTPAAKQQTPAAKQQTPAAKQQTPAAKQQTPAAKQQTPSAKQQTPAAKQQTPAAKQQTPAAKQQQPEDDDDDEDDDDEDDDDDDDEDDEEEGDEDSETDAVVGKPTAKAQQKQVDDKDDSEEDDDDDDEDDEDETDEEDASDDKVPVAKKLAPVDTDSEDDEDGNDDEEDDKPQTLKPVSKRQPVAAKSATNKPKTAAAIPIPKPTHYLLLSNLEAQSSVPDLKNFLSRRGVAYVSAAILDSPVAILGLSSQSDSEAALAKCQGADYKNRKLAACQLAGRPDQMLQARALPGNTDSSKLFVANLPAELTDTSLIALVKEKLGGFSNELVSAHLLQKKGSAKGVHRGQAIVELAGAAAAQTLLEALSGHLLAGRPVKASYYVASSPAAKDALQASNANNNKPQQEHKGSDANKKPNSEKGSNHSNSGAANSRQELRGQTRTLLLLNLPTDVCTDDSELRAAFPGGQRYGTNTKSGADSALCFVEFDTEDACSEAFDKFAKSGSFEGRDIGVTFVPQRQPRQAQAGGGGGGGQEREKKSPSKTLGVFNLPFSATDETLREKFPDAQDLFIPKDQSGKSRGFAIVMFDTVEAASSALEKNAELTIEGRTARVEFREDRKPGGDGGGGGRGGFRGRGGFGGRGGRGGGGFGGDRGGRGGFGGRGGRGGGGFGGDRGGRGGFGGRGGGRGRGGFGDRGGKRPSFGGGGDSEGGAKKQKFDSDSD